MFAIIIFLVTVGASSGVLGDHAAAAMANVSEASSTSTMGASLIATAATAALF